MLKKRKQRMKGDRAMQVLSTIVLLFVLVIVAYPVMYVISCSFSSEEAITAGRILLWPVEVCLDGYKFVFRYKQVMVGYRNTIIYAICGLALEMFLTVCAAYPLSRREYPRRKFCNTVFIVAMMTSAGMIPAYLVRAKLGLIGNPLVVVLSGALGVRNIMILRTAFNAIPGELYDAAQVDGASQLQRLRIIALPLAKATLSTLMLFSIVGYWNNYFTAMIYLRDERMYPLQLVLRNILTAAKTLDLSEVSSLDMIALAQTGQEQIKYALIVIASAPLLILYMIIQKSFKKGYMLGAVKG